MKIKKGDNVIVIAGKDKGKKAKVISVLVKEQKLIVEGVNIVKKHQKSRQRNKKGETIEKTLPIHISNVAIGDPKDGKPARVGYKIDGDKKTRISKRSGQKI